MPSIMRRTLLVSFLLAANLASQAYVYSPKHYATTEAQGANAFPFGSLTQMWRYLQIYDELNGTPFVITGFSVRPNGGWQTVFNTPAYSTTMDIFVSTALTASGNASTNFDNNHGTDKAQVANLRTYNLGACVSSFVPNPVWHRFPFDVPFPFTGTGSLALEVRIQSNTMTSAYVLDTAANAQTNPVLQYAYFGSGCIATGQTVTYNAIGGQSMNWPNGTGTLFVTGDKGPANAIVIAFLGFQNQTAGGIPLPLLVPGTNGFPSGDCHLYTDIALVYGTVSSGTGASSTSVPIPATANLHGLRVFAQLMAQDATANAFGFVFSNLINFQWVAPFPAGPGARVYAQGSWAATGIKQTSQCLVTRFE
jgi:hypothetical protein